MDFTIHENYFLTMNYFQTTVYKKLFCKIKPPSYFSDRLAELYCLIYKCFTQPYIYVVTYFS